MVLCIASLICFQHTCHTQNNNQNHYFGKSLMLRMTGSYIPFESNFSSTFNPAYFHETVLSPVVGISISKSLILGVELNAILTKNSFKDRENYFVGGALAQYDVFPNRKARLLLETTFTRGDYCFCGVNGAFRKTGLYYVGYGTGLELPVRNGPFFIHGGFRIHSLLNSQENNFQGYNIYKLGFTYLFGKVNQTP